MNFFRKAVKAVLLKYIMVAALAAAVLGFSSGTQAGAEENAEDFVYYVGTANGTVNVRSGPGVEYDQLTDAAGNKIKLSAQEEIVIIGEAASSEGKIWYNIKFEREGVEYKGYATSSYVSKDESRTITPTPTPTPEPTPTPTPTPEPTPEPTAEPTPTQPLVPENTEKGNSREEILKTILIVIGVAVVVLIGLIVFKLVSDRRPGRGDAASKKVDKLRKLNIDNHDSGRKVPQIKKLDTDSSVAEEVRQDVYYKRSTMTEDDIRKNAEKDTDERRALRAAIDRLQEHDIVYHTTYGEGEVFDNSDVKLIEVRFGNDMRFLKKDQLVAKKELLLIDDEDQSIAKRRNRRKTTK